jgi:hypothetical protein
VLAFGAWGDGTEDDTQLIQDILKIKHFVYFPSGTFIVNGSLETGDIEGQRIMGAGKCAVIKLNSKQTYDLSSRSYSALRMRASKQTLDNVTLKGPDTNDDSNFTVSSSGD